LSLVRTDEINADDKSAKAAAPATPRTTIDERERAMFN
jgi:hypothetical protein